jgi:hypothetical protein
MKTAKLISYILHPIIVPIIGTLLYFIILPRHTRRTLEITIILYVFFGTYLLPLIFLAVLKKSKAIKSFKLMQIEERKSPILFLVFVTSLLGTIFYRSRISADLSLFLFGSSLALMAAYLLIFKKFKVSLHMIGIGGLIGFILFFSYKYTINNLLTLSFLFIITGLIGHSRLSLKVHNQKEIYWGFIIGLSSQLIVYFYNI